MSVLGYEFSTRVSIQLLFAGDTIHVAQSGGDFIIASYPFDVPAGLGTLVVRVNEDEERLQIFLPEGLRAGRTEHPIQLLSNPVA